MSSFSPANENYGISLAISSQNRPNRVQPEKILRHRARMSRITGEFQIVMGSRFNKMK